MIQGDFSQNSLEGKGTYRWKDGATYTGGWCNNKMHSEKGCYVDRHGVKWEGKFDNGQYYNGKVFLNLR